jgi:hypothetical protein
MTAPPIGTAFVVPPSLPVICDEAWRKSLTDILVNSYNPQVWLVGYVKGLLDYTPDPLPQIKAAFDLFYDLKHKGMLR